MVFQQRVKKRSSVRQIRWDFSPTRNMTRLHDGLALSYVKLFQYPKCAYGPYCYLNPIKNGVYILEEVSYFNYLVSVTAGGPESPRAHVVKFYGRLQLIRSV